MNLIFAFSKINLNTQQYRLTLTILSLLCVPFITFYIVPNYIHLKHQKGKIKSLFLKGLGTFISVAFCIIGTLHTPNRFSYLILTGLCLGLLGDILLELFLPLGGTSFFLGNAVYIYCMLLLKPLRLCNIILFFLCMVFLLFRFGKDFTKFGPYRIFFLIYAFIISLMAGVAIPLSFWKIEKPSINSMMLGFGTLLFAISDYLLAYRILYNSSTKSHSISLTVYYLAQFCISLSTLT